MSYIDEKPKPGHPGRDFKQSDIRIPSSTTGWDLDAWRFIPTRGPPRVPVVVMAHGLGCNKTMGLREFAEFYAGLGYAVVAFDYRHWGASDGTPRSILSVDEQLEDYGTVVKFCRHQPEYDPDKIILWGTCFSGGHVTTLAAERNLNVCAAIAQCPYLGTVTPWPFGWTFIKTFVHGLMDALLQLVLGYSPHYIRLSAPSDEVGVMNKGDSWEGFKNIAWGLPGANTPNEINAFTIFTLGKYQPRDTAEDIACPILFINMIQDALVTMDAAEDCEARISPCYLTNVKLDGGHFDLYPGGRFYDAGLSATKKFLQKHVPI